MHCTDVAEKFPRKSFNERRLERLLKLKTPVQLTSVQTVADHELYVMWRMWCCWWLHVQSGRCTQSQTHQSVVEISRNTWKWSVVSWSRHLFSEPLTQRKTTSPFTVADVFSASAATQLTRVGNYRYAIKLETMVFRTLFAKITKIGSLSYRRKPSRHFWRHVVMDLGYLFFRLGVSNT